MFACIKLINKAIDLKIRIINIFSSYIGIKNFAEKTWSVKKEAPTEYIKLNFSYTSSSNDNIRKAKMIAMNADRINK